MKIKLLGYYNYTVVLTYIGAVMGMVGIMYAMNGNIKSSMVCLMICGICDMFDGTIAGTMKRTENEKSFGIQIDSLCDLICFCVFPSIMLISVKNSILCCIVSALYTLCGLIRLAYFNVDELARQKNTSERRTMIHGLPVTTSALIVPFTYILSSFLGKPLEIFEVPALLLTSLLFLMPFEMKKPQTAGKIIMILCGLAMFISVFAVKGV